MGQFGKPQASPKRQREGELLLGFRRKLGGLFGTEAQGRGIRVGACESFSLACKQWLVPCC